VFGELSSFLRGLGHHLTDMRPVEVATLAPLVVLTLLFGIFPGLLLGLLDAPVDAVLATVERAADVAGLAP
jgi:NADH:ubiquinone oxidoreductase subunit 4 (subunit M)